MTLPDYLASGEHARLIPVAADSSREVRAASIVFATLAAVPPFAQMMLASVGQRVGTRARLDCYTEISFRGSKDEAKARPDGLMVLDGGRGRTWRCLVEAKIGKADLEDEQVCRYLALAKTHKIDAVLTISNQFVALPSHSPVSVPKASLRGVELLHWSWMYLLTQAMLLLGDSSLDPPEQRYIVAEMVRYFSHPSVGVSTFDRMNSEWKDLNAQVQARAKLNRAAPIVEKSVAAWHQEVRDLCLSLTRKVGRPVRIRLSRAHTDDPVQRLRDDSALVVDAHELRCALDVPDAAAPLVIIANLQLRTISISMTLSAPRDKQRTSSRIAWILRQLAKADAEGLLVRAFWPGKAPPTQGMLASLRDDPSPLDAANPALVPSHFEVVLIRDLAGRFSGPKTFIEQLEDVVPAFYDQVGQRLRAYVPAPPRLRKEEGAMDANDALEAVAEAAELAAADAADGAQAAKTITSVPLLEQQDGD
jgi:hypothetical protein